MIWMGTTAFFLFTTVLISIFAARMFIKIRRSRNVAEPESEHEYIDNVIVPNFVPPMPPQGVTRGEASSEAVYNNQELYEL